MTAMLAILTRLPWSKIAIGLLGAGILVLLWRAPWAESRGYHSRDNEVRLLTQDRDTWKASAAVLDRSIKDQNAAIIASKADSEQRMKDGQAALAEAQRENASLASTAAALRKSSGVKRASDEPCQISKTLAGAKL